MRIALFATCLNDAMFPQAPAATVRLLERLGHEVVFPPAQACCGQMHVNTGYSAQAVPVIRNHVRGLRAGARRRVGRRRRAVGLVRGLGAPPAGDGRRPGGRAGAGPGRGAGGGAHLRAVRAARRRPRRHRRRRLVPAPRSPTTPPATRCACSRSATGRCGCCAPSTASTSSSCPRRPRCCGFGGTFALKNAETSTAMVTDKVRNVVATGAEVLAAGDYSCLMHIGGALSRGAHRRARRAPRRDPRRHPRGAVDPDRAAGGPARRHPPERLVPGRRGRARGAGRHDGGDRRARAPQNRRREPDERHVPRPARGAAPAAPPPGGPAAVGPDLPRGGPRDPGATPRCGPTSATPPARSGTSGCG